jgi:hypothetical protein
MSHKNFELTYTNSDENFYGEYPDSYREANC